MINNNNQNGNLASTSASQTNTWDYRNRLTTATKSGTSTTYAYDVNEQRVQKTVGGKVTRYPSQYFETTGASTTKHVYANGTLVSTVDGTGSTSASVFHNHQDHLGSTAAVTSNIGYMTRIYTYYPYGSLRLDEGSASTTFTQPNQFIGQDRDKEADLSYLNARYYSSNQGMFTSQDPVFWSEKQNLANPQSLNSYVYAEGSPVGKKDPDGRAAYIWNNGAGMSGIDTWNTNTYYESQDQAMLAGNAGYMQSLSGSGLLRDIVFANKSREGGDWDYKSNDENRKFYFFDGNLMNKESFGNIHYGYVGTAAGYRPTTLKVVGGAVHIATSVKSGGKTKIGSAKSYFDDARDTKNISKGINTYNSKQSKSIGNASASLSSASAAIARGDYSGAIKSLQSASNSLGKNKK